MSPFAITANTNTTYTTCSVTIPTATANVWLNGGGTGNVAAPAIYYHPSSGSNSANGPRLTPQPQLTPEEVAQRRERRLERERQLIRDRPAAEARARELLLTYLDDAQREQYEEAKNFVVEVRGKRYLITRKRSENVYQIEADGRPLERYCIHPGDYEVPLEDQMLAQKIMLEVEEEEFFRIANRF